MYVVPHSIVDHGRADHSCSFVQTRDSCRESNHPRECKYHQREVTLCWKTEGKTRCWSFDPVTRCIYLEREVQRMKPFHEILQETHRVANGLGAAELSRLNTAMGYWAPEMREHCFWYGSGTVWGYLDILNNYFQDNKQVYNIYNDFMDTYYKRTRIEV